jgi:hypothetical protein
MVSASGVVVEVEVELEMKVKMEVAESTAEVEVRCLSSGVLIVFLCVPRARPLVSRELMHLSEYEIDYNLRD